MSKRQQESAEIYFPVREPGKRARFWMDTNDRDFRHMLRTWQRFPSTARLPLAVIPHNGH